MAHLPFRERLGQGPVLADGAMGTIETKAWEDNPGTPHADQTTHNDLTIGPIHCVDSSLVSHYSRGIRSPLTHIP
jgi:hypothetical protein